MPVPPLADHGDVHQANVDDAIFDTRDDFLTTITTAVDDIDAALTSLSLSLHDHPEIAFEEHFAHDTLTEFMEQHGFTVTRHYLGLQTAWRAEFTHGEGGRTIGINSEMDALPLIGHACGHNMIAASGAGAAIAIKHALLAHDISGKVVLLGTPAEEIGGGKIILLERGGYDGMDACLMCHPVPGPPNSVFIAPHMALQVANIEFFGHSAHTGGSPWEGVNALDAAVLAYTNVATLRQQIKPGHTVSGVIRGCNGPGNVIPDHTEMEWFIRAPDRDQLQSLKGRVEACFRAAASATGCRILIKQGSSYDNLRHNSVLGRYFSQAMNSHFGMDTVQVSVGAATDFGNVSYALPSLHPNFAIPTQPKGGNHTPEFTVSTRSVEAHKACMKVIQGLALTGLLVLSDDKFYAEVRNEYQRTLCTPSAQ